MFAASSTWVPYIALWLVGIPVAIAMYKSAPEPPGGDQQLSGSRNMILWMGFIPCCFVNLMGPVYAYFDYKKELRQKQEQANLNMRFEGSSFNPEPRSGSPFPATPSDQNPFGPTTPPPPPPRPSETPNSPQPLPPATRPPSDPSDNPFL